MAEYRINVYEDGQHDEIIARVRYNQCLDYWDGRNWTSGGVGRHLGLTKLKDGRYVLIFGTEWQGEKDYAEVVTPEEALQAILRTQNTDLLKTKKFKALKELADKMGALESGDDEE